MKEIHLAQMVKNRAEKYGDREVYRFKKNDKFESTSWNKLKQNIDQVSKYLVTQNVGFADNVGIYSQNYPEWTICDLGILSIRAVVVPIYATSTYSQLEYIVTETEMQIICVGDNVQLKNALIALDNLPSLKKIITIDCDNVDDDRVVSLDKILSKEYDENTVNIVAKRFAEVSIDDLATIIYTSGTTGVPKGVLLNHSNFIRLIEIHDIRLKLGEDDVSMCFLPLSHIFERAWTYFVMHSGAVNVYNVNPKAIIEELPKVKPTVMCAVPRFFEKTYEGITQTTETWSKPQKAIFEWALSVGLEHIEFKKDSLKVPLLLHIKHSIANILVMKKLRKVFGGNIKYMPCAGAAISMEILKFFHAMGLIVNYGYGATETSATVSCMRHDKYDFEYTGSIMPDVEVKINKEDNMILIKGDTVFKGYYKKPKETAETLIDGWYYSGDQGAIPHPGTLHMTERIKDIIKTSTGKYVSPQKIEMLLSDSKYIEHICVIGDNRKYITALIVPQYEKIKEYANEKGIKSNNNKELVSNAVVNELVKNSIDSIQADLSSFEKVVKFTLLSEPFTIDNSLLTNSLKVRRKQVNIEYTETISKMY